MQIQNVCSTRLNSEEHHGVLAQELQHVRQGEEGDVDVLRGLQHEHQAGHGRNQVPVREICTLIKLNISGKNFGKSISLKSHLWEVQ